MQTPGGPLDWELGALHWGARAGPMQLAGPGSKWSWGASRGP